MAGIVVAFSKPEDGKNIKGILTRNGFHVTAVCTSGAQAITAAESLEDGVVVCGYRLADMQCDELRRFLPAGVGMLLIASPSRLGGSVPKGVIFLPMPLKAGELVSTLEVVLQAQARSRRKKHSGPRERSREERELIAQAKALLMERNNMTEAEAHRYIQKCSMDSGTGLIETAHKVIDLLL